MTLEQAKEKIHVDLVSTFNWIKSLARLEGARTQDAGYRNEAEVLKAIRDAVEKHCKFTDKILDDVPE